MSVSPHKTFLENLSGPYLWKVEDRSLIIMYHLHTTVHNIHFDLRWDVILVFDPPDVLQCSGVYSKWFEQDVGVNLFIVFPAEVLTVTQQEAPPHQHDLLTNPEVFRREYSFTSCGETSRTQRQSSGLIYWLYPLIMLKLNKNAVYLGPNLKKGKINILIGK